jgi:hypothetical protein
MNAPLRTSLLLLTPELTVRPRLEFGLECLHPFGFSDAYTDYNGAYLMDGHIADSIPPTVQNPEDVDRLWELSEKLVGQKFQY